mmetsp:Transcript_82116/g.232772  ORF Transcript_82116/g.232772 Transcript_82116/m.232772 type:complete len:316 (+) Transcript_82116:283-1230(+)
MGRRCVPVCRPAHDHGTELPDPQGWLLERHRAPQREQRVPDRGPRAGGPESERPRLQLDHPGGGEGGPQQRLRGRAELPEGVPAEHRLVEARRVAGQQPVLGAVPGERRPRRAAGALQEKLRAVPAPVGARAGEAEGRGVPGGGPRPRRRGEVPGVAPGAPAPVGRARGGGRAGAPGLRQRARGRPLPRHPRVRRLPREDPGALRARRRRRPHVLARGAGPREGPARHAAGHPREGRHPLRHLAPQRPHGGEGPALPHRLRPLPGRGRGLLQPRRGDLRVQLRPRRLPGEAEPRGRPRVPRLAAVALCLRAAAMA